MSKTIIRLSIFGIAMYFIAILIFAWNGIDISSDVFRLPLELILFLAANDDKKYNCRYARFLALSVFATDTFSYMDKVFDLVPNTYVFLGIISVLWTAAITATIVLGVIHFRKVRRIKKEKTSNYEQ